jgi:hypothetical protein
MVRIICRESTDLMLMDEVNKVAIREPSGLGMLCGEAIHMRIRTTVYQFPNVLGVPCLASHLNAIENRITPDLAMVS